MSCRGECTGRQGTHLHSATCVDRPRIDRRSGRAVVIRTSAPHLVTITPEDDGEFCTYVWSCSCGKAFGRTDTDAEARSTARHHDPAVTFAQRAEMPFEIVAANPRKAG